MDRGVSECKYMYVLLVFTDLAQRAGSGIEDEDEA